MGIASGAFGYQTPRKKFGVETAEPHTAEQAAGLGQWLAENNRVHQQRRLGELNQQYGQSPMSRTPQRAPGGQVMQAVIPGGETEQTQQQNGGVSMPSWNFVPRPGYNRAAPATRPDMGNSILRRGHLGFADSMQDAMSQMMGMNLANQQASLQNKDMWLNYLLGRDQAAAAVEAEKVRAMALAAALGGGGGHGGKPRMMSNIGQSINPWG